MKRVGLLLLTAIASYGYGFAQEPDSKATDTLSQTRLEEIVVVGYGAVKKTDLTGAVQNFSANEVASTGEVEFERALQGRVSGVYIAPTTGSPGSSYSINFRGRGSINAGGQPLFIVDGVVFSNASRSSGVISDANVMSWLNPADIETISVIKDGATASIYGSEAANGVIIITTKKGSYGKSRISFTSNVGVQKLAHKPSLMNGREWAEYTLLEYKNYSPALYQKRLAAYQGYGWGSDGYSLAPTTSWYKEIYRTSTAQNYSLTISGGGYKTRFYISGNYNKNDGIIKHTSFSRGTLRLNVSHEVAKYLTVSSFSSFSRNIFNQPSSSAPANPVRGALFTIPTFAPKNAEGEYIAMNPLGGIYGYNTAQILSLNENYGKNSNLISSNSLTFKILDKLEFKSSYIVGYTWVNEHQYIDPRTAIGSRTSGMVGSFALDVTKFQTDQVASYSDTFGILSIAATAGASYIDSKTHISGASAIGFASPDLHLLSGASTPVAAVENYSQWKSAGLFARINASCLHKYLISATLRYDGSSKFGEDRQWGLFPSVSAAWKIVKNLKLRAGYGVTGNANIGAYSAKRLYEGGHNYAGIAGLRPTSPGNTKLTWEKNRSFNIGVSGNFWNSRLAFDVDYYIGKTKDLLYERVIPSTTQFNTMPSNMGGVKNTGLDILLNTNNLQLRDFNWRSSLNLSYCHNKITALQDGLSQIGDYRVGKPVSSKPLYKYAGADPKTGMPTYYDKTGAITLTPSPTDRYFSKGEDPRLFGSFENTIAWRGFSLNFLFRFQSGAEKLWSDKAVLTGQTGNTNLLKEVYDNRWTKPGDIRQLPKAQYALQIEPTASLFYKSTNFFRLTNVCLSYTLKAYGLRSLKIYIAAYNPEEAVYESGVYPLAKSITMGVTIQL